jgi:NitT/TauT family transport system substrate-binding protein
MLVNRTLVNRTLVNRLITVLSILLLTACGYGSEARTRDGTSTPTGRKLSVDEVRIGYLPNLTHATALVGIKEGILAKELGGTRLKALTFNAGPAEIEALNAGSVDIGWIGPSPAINAFTRSGGTSLRIISGATSGGVKLVVNPRIKTLDDLKGKKIATPQLGNTQDVALLNWITARGWQVDPPSGRGDVSVVRTDNAEVPAAYQSGAVDGAWVPEPTAAKLVAEGATELLDESALWPGGKFVTTTMIVSQRFLAAHPDVVEAVLRGSVAANAWINANSAAAKASANTALKDLTGKELPADVIDRAWKSIQVTDDPLAATLTTEADHAMKSGLVTNADLSGIYDLKPLNTVLRSLSRPAADDAGLGAR